MAFRPGGIDLHDRHVPETIEDKTGQSIRFGMDQPVERGLEQPLTQRQRGAEAGD